MLASRFSRVFRSSFASSNAFSSLNRLSLPSSSSMINAFSPIRSFSSSPSSVSSTPADSGSSVDTEGQYGYSSVDNYMEDDKLFPGQHGDPTNRAFAYFMQGTSAFLYASVARVAVIRFVATLSASADVLALSSLEVDLTPIQEGTSVTVKWRGKPVFIRHRTPKEIAQAKSDDAIASSFRHPEQDAERVKEDKWMIVLGVCTHLGCVPIGSSGDYNGWFCPCHGSHYDTSGRIRKGPAPLNLEVPAYKFTGPTKVLIG